MSEQDLIDRQALLEFVKATLRKDVDYGVIPGTEKYVLLKPGAEKLCNRYSISVTDPVLVKSVEDWQGSNTGGEPFFYYMVMQRLTRGEMSWSQAGSCNSWETKYRYRKAERKCPECGKATILRSKFPPRHDPGGTPGWYCFTKRGGCGFEFDNNDERIIHQAQGQVPNDHIFDQVNTLLKMAQKRALVAATLIAVNGSDMFTQDEEVLGLPEPETQTQEQTQTQAPPPPAVETITAEQWNQICKEVDYEEEALGNILKSVGVRRGGQIPVSKFDEIMANLRGEGQAPPTDQYGEIQHDEIPF